MNDAELSKGVGLQSLMTFITGFSPLLILIASFVNKKAVWKLTKFDLVCGILSFFGLMLWAVTREGNIAIVFSILADGLAAIPTVVKSYTHPESENWIAFAAAAVSAALTILSINNWTFANYGFPAYILTICLILFTLIKLQPQKT